MSDRFSKYHPLTNFIFFTTITLITVLSLHPAVLCVSFAGAFIYGVVLNGFVKTLKSALCFALPIALLTAVINPLFNHYGVTVLFFLPGGNPFTLETVLYGLSSGLMMASIVMWFICISKVMTSDKYICLIGNAFPHAALLISMIMRFVPLFDRQRRKIKSARQCVGQCGGESLTNLSILTTWALENNVHIADSMISRGYGSGRRTFYGIYTFKKRDVFALLYMTLFALIYLTGCLCGVFKASYDPIINVSLNVNMIPGITALLLFSLYPIIINLKEYIFVHSHKQSRP